MKRSPSSRRMNVSIIAEWLLRDEPESMIA
jgi:hypothetical protein